MATITRRASREATAPVQMPSPSPTTRKALRWQRVAELAVAIAGVGAALAVLEGSWWWAVVRVLAAGVVVSRTLLVLRRGSRRSSAVATFVVGLVALAAGGALGASYARAGASVRLVGGVTMAAAGLVLLAVGIGWLLRSVDGWKRIAVIPVALCAVYAIGSPVAVATYATNVGRAPLGAATPADRGLQAIDVTFTTTDGVHLSGWYVASTNRAAVVLLHGASSTRTAVLDQAVVLARHGYGVLLFDARGMGRSGGRAMALGWYGDRDVAAAVDYLRSRADVDPNRIGALGESMGGEEAIGAMASDRRLRAVVAEGATNRVLSDWNWLSDRYGLRGTLQRGIHWLTSNLTDLLTAARPPVSLRIAVAKAAPRPVLLIAAGTVPDEANADRYIQDGAPQSVQLWIVPGAPHTGGLRTQPGEWEQRVIAFFDRTLAA